MTLNQNDHRRLVDMKEDEGRAEDIRFLARCVWLLNLELSRREDYEAEQAEQGD